MIYGAKKYIWAYTVDGKIKLIAWDDCVVTSTMVYQDQPHWGQWNEVILY